MQAKPVQIAIIVIGLIVGIVGIFLAVSGKSGPDLADKMVLVDVKTGETYAVSLKGRSVVLPYKHPETQEKTLLPIEFDQDSQSWSLISRYMAAIERIDGVSNLIDTETGKIDIPSDTKPKSIK